MNEQTRAEGIRPAEDIASLPPARVPLNLPPGFSWKAVAVVMAEKFGLRGLRISAMIGVMIGYFWWRGCDGIICNIFYVAAAGTTVMVVLVVWTAKEALDKFAREHANNAWLVLDDDGVGGEAIVAGQEKRFKLPWEHFRRVVERNRFWVLETVHGGWLVLPTSHFSPQAWAHMRARRRARTVGR